jgi:hypothetical protein
MQTLLQAKVPLLISNPSWVAIQHTILQIPIAFPENSKHVQWTGPLAGRFSAQTYAFHTARGGSTPMWPNGFDNPYTFSWASWVESFIKIAKSLPLGRLLHGSRRLQWPCQGIFSFLGQFQGTGKRQGSPGWGQACGLAWSFQGLVAAPLGPFKNILPLDLPAQWLLGMLSLDSIIHMWERPHCLWISLWNLSVPIVHLSILLEFLINYYLIYV